MLAANGRRQPTLEPIHYVEEKPFKMAEHFKKKRRKLSAKKSAKKRTLISKIKRSGKSKQQSEIKLELETSCHEDDDQEHMKSSTNDPLFTPDMLVKCELKDSKLEDRKEASEKCSVTTDEDFSADEYSDDANTVEEEEEEFYAKSNKKKFDSSSEATTSNESDSNDDEPLRRLQEKLGRGPYKKPKTPRFKDCLETCKHKCINKFDKQKRLDMYEFYWQLSQEDKVKFIRTHVRKPIVKYLNRNTSRSTCCYYLKHYKVADIICCPKQNEGISSETANKIKFSYDDEDLTKVCRLFFGGTLKTSDQDVKDALKDFELIPEIIKRHVKDAEKQDSATTAKTQEMKISQPQKYLDPETGDLLDKKPKKQTPRRNRNEPPPKRYPKPINCSIRCKFKCHEKFSEEERRQICDVFWSLDYKRRKDFVLSRIEIKDVKTPLNPEYRKTNRPPRSYQTKFYLRAGPKTENVRVCKHFMEKTLNVNRCFIENAIEFADKTTGAYTSFDRRGQNMPHNKISDERKQTILDHINSYPLWIPHEKSKIKCLHYSLSIKKMFDAYKEKCLADKIEPLPLHYYYKVFHADFRMLFLTNPGPKKGRGYYKTNPNICHYTGEESGGCWIDSKGTKLDLRYVNPALTLDVNQKRYFLLNTYSVSNSTEASALNLAYNSSETFDVNQGLNQGQELISEVKPEIASAQYGNVSVDSVHRL